MPFPPEIITRSISIGGAYAMETGDPLRVSVTITASKNLVWDATGVRFEKVAVKATSEAGTEVVIELPCTNVDGWRDPTVNQLIEITDPNQYTHTYTAQVSYLDANGVAVGTADKIGSFVVPQGVGTIDLDTTIPVGSTSGDLILVPFPTVEDADVDTKGVLMLTGDLGGTADSPTVPYMLSRLLYDFKGDLLVGQSNNVGAPLNVGPKDTVLTADSSKALGLYWAQPNYPKTPFAAAGTWRAPYGQQNAAAAQTSGRLQMIPIYIDRPMQISGLGAYVKVAGSAEATTELAIYSDNGSFNPGARIATTGPLSAAAVGVISGTFSAITVTPGWIWIGTLTVFTTTSPQLQRCGQVGDSNASIQMWASLDGGTGTAPTISVGASSNTAYMNGQTAAPASWSGALTGSFSPNYLTLKLTPA